MIIDIDDQVLSVYLFSSKVFYHAGYHLSLLKWSFFTIKAQKTKKIFLKRKDLVFLA